MNVNIGKIGEDMACDYLLKKGYRIRERNFRIRGGEIDIIAQEGNTLVYIEVKTRTSQKFGTPGEAITSKKLKFLERAAKFYRLKRLNLPLLERIDMVGVDLADFNSPTFDLIRNIS